MIFSTLMQLFVLFYPGVQLHHVTHVVFQLSTRLGTFLIVSMHFFPPAAPIESFDGAFPFNNN